MGEHANHRMVREGSSKLSLLFLTLYLYAVETHALPQVKALCWGIAAVVLGTNVFLIYDFITDRYAVAP